MRRSAGCRSLDTRGRGADRLDAERWLSTQDAAREIGGVSARWVRKQIEAGRLPARALLTGRRPTYRFLERDLLTGEPLEADSAPQHGLAVGGEGGHPALP